MVRKLQPDACIFSDVGPDLRWVGNESGYAAATSWATYDPVGEKGDLAAPGYVRSAEGETGQRNAARWLPSECDVSIRPGWFWHATEDQKVKSVTQLLDLYYRSVGHGASFLLNVPPNWHGQISDQDVLALKAFGEVVSQTFAHNLASTAIATASNLRGNSQAFGAANLVSRDPRRYWSTDDAVTTPSVDLDLGSPKAFDVIRLREAIQLGQRVGSFSVDAWIDGAWKEVAAATSVGSCRLIRLRSPVTASRVRLRITDSAACVALYDFGLFKQPTLFGAIQP